MSVARPDTWMPMYWADYLADTGDLSAIEHGAYLMLIAHYWRKAQPLPDDDAKLARIAKCTPQEWAGVRPAICGFFRIENGTWTQGRVRAELYKAQIKYNKRLGAKGNLPSKLGADLLPDLGVQPQPQPHLSYEREAPVSERNRSGRLPSNWQLPGPWRDWTLAELQPRGIDEALALPWISRTAEVFRDYWSAKAGPNATKADWLATWRNWVRRELDTGKGPAPTGNRPQKETTPENRLRLITAEERDLATRLRKFHGNNVSDAQVAAWRELERAAAV